MKIGEETKTFTVKYVIDVKSVEVNTATFDDERANQKVTFKINGESVDADPEYLALAGYSVNYVIKDGTDLFLDPAAPTTPVNVSATGILANGPLAIDDYEVEVQLIKSGVAMVSGTQTIKIRDIDGETTAVSSARFINGGSNNAVATAPGATTISATDFAMNSNTLVAGEVVLVDNVKATIAGDETTLTAADKITSSNPAVISVVGSTLTAESAGTATITVKVGDVTKTYNFTVTNTTRTLTKVVPKASSVKLVSGISTTLNVKTLDQYGDPIAAIGTDIVENVPTNANGAALITGTAPDVVTADNGSVDLTLTGAALANSGSGNIFFKKGIDVIGSVLVTLSGTNNVDASKAKLEVVSATSESDDAVLDLTDSNDDQVEYQLSEFTSEGLYVGVRDLGGYKIEVADPSVLTVTANATSTTTTVGQITIPAATAPATVDKFVVDAVKAGSTDIVLKDANGAFVRSVKVTVTEDKFGIKSIALKTVPTVTNIGQVLKASNALTLTSSTQDDIVEGVTLTKSTQAKVRIAEAAGGAAVTDLYAGSVTIAEGDLYLDLDNNAQYSAGDVKLGSVEASFTTDSNTTLTAGASLTTVYAGVQTTASGAKGTLIFKVMKDPSDVTTSIAATSIAVDVK